MKLSNITKPVTGLLFWSMLTYILYSLESWNINGCCNAYFYALLYDKDYAE